MIRWTEDEVGVLKKYYGKIPAINIQKKYLNSRTTRSIIQKANYIGLYTDKSEMSRIAHTKYQYNKLFFRSLSIDSCYWAGFIAADGYIKSSRKCLVIELGLNDKEHLKKFANAIKFNGPISTYNRQSCIIRIGCKDIIDDLENIFSIVNCKSNILKPPKLFDKRYIRAFIRGYFDGDGSICRTKKTRSYNMNITSGSKYILNWILYQIKLFVPSVSCCVRKVSNRNYYELRIYKQNHIVYFMNWLYSESNSNNRLSRKYYNVCGLKYNLYNERQIRIVS